MPVTIPPPLVLDQFLGATTRHVRRVEIYESDGVTRWEKDTVARLRDGSVSVDYGRDERRTVELTLGNADRVLVNKPGEFWYDKIIKVFRGVNVYAGKILPKIVVVADGAENYSAAVAFRDAMISLGYGEVRIDLSIGALSDLDGYDIVVGLNSTTAAKNTLLLDAYNAGYPVILLGEARSDNYPGMWPGVTDQNETLFPTTVVQPLPVSHPANRGWSGFDYSFFLNTGTSSLAYDIPLLDQMEAVSGVEVLSKSEEYGAVLSVREISNKKLAAYHLPVPVQLFEETQFKLLLLSLVNWINPIKPIGTWEVQIGEFMIDRITEAHFPHAFKISGRDYTKKCLLSKYEHATSFPASQSLESIVGTIAGAAGISKRILPTTGITIDREFYFDRGVSRWEAMKEITNAYNYELFFDATGYLVMRPYNDPILTAPSITIKTGEKGQLASYELSTSDSRILNHILVVGASSDNAIANVWAEARNLNPSSPTSIEKLGDRFDEYESEFIETQAQAQAKADMLLSVNSLEEYELNFESLMLPWLEVGDIMGFEVDREATPETFLLSSLTLPLTLGPMSGVGRRIINVI